MYPPVYVETLRGEFRNINGYSAYNGFIEKGYEVKKFDRDGVYFPPLNLSEKPIIVANIPLIKKVLPVLGHPVPEMIDYPAPLEKYLGRKIWSGTLGEIRGRANEGLFVKPKDEQKGFVGVVVNRIDDLIEVAHFQDDYNLWISEPVNFVSEWRTYIVNKEITKICNYRGDPFIIPNKDTVYQAYADYENAPCSFGLDFGVTDDGRTLLVEANDGFALGNYGIFPVVYATLIETRWYEMTGFNPDQSLTQ